MLLKLAVTSGILKRCSLLSMNRLPYIRKVPNFQARRLNGLSQGPGLNKISDLDKLSYRKIGVISYSGNTYKYYFAVAGILTALFGLKTIYIDFGVSSFSIKLSNILISSLVILFLFGAKRIPYIQKLDTFIILAVGFVLSLYSVTQTPAPHATVTTRLFSLVHAEVKETAFLVFLSLCSLPALWALPVRFRSYILGTLMALTWSISTAAVVSGTKADFVLSTASISTAALLGTYAYLSRTMPINVLTLEFLISFFLPMLMVSRQANVNCQLLAFNAFKPGLRFHFEVCGIVAIMVTCFNMFLLPYYMIQNLNDAAHLPMLFTTFYTATHSDRFIDCNKRTYEQDAEILLGSYKSLL